MGRTVNDIVRMKKEGTRISMLTAYDYYSGKLVSGAGIDIILVGDSLGMVMQGHKNTLPVTLEDMIYHTKMVDRGRSDALLVTDLPFMSFQESVSRAMSSAGRIMKESGAQAVKLEGGSRVIPQVKAMTDAGIPVMGHLGLTPQSVNQFGGFKVQGKQEESARTLIEDALELQKAGAFSVVLETVPRELAEVITRKLDIPTIGIGAGPDCDGQVLVLHDLLGYDEEFNPTFVRKYAELNRVIKKAVTEYINDIKGDSFPDDNESFHMEQDTARKLREEYLNSGDN